MRQIDFISIITVNKCSKMVFNIDKKLLQESYVQIEAVQQPNNCLNCGKIYVSLNDLNKHQIENQLCKEKTSVDQSKTGHNCEICHKTFRYYYNIKTHIEFVHRNIRKYKCENM